MPREHHSKVTPFLPSMAPNFVDMRGEGRKVMLPVDPSYDDHQRAQSIFKSFVERASGKVSLAQLFRQWDHDRSGFLDFEKFRRGLDLLGYSVSKSIILILWNMFDIDGNGLIDLSEFTKTLSPEPPASDTTYLARRSSAMKRMPRDPRPNVHKAFDTDLPVEERAQRALNLLVSRLEGSQNVFKFFRAWDQDKNGTVSPEELCEGMRNLQIEVSDEVLRELMTTFDKNGNGIIEYKEFAAVVRPGAEVFSGDATSPSRIVTRPSPKEVEHELSNIWKRLPNDKNILEDVLRKYDRSGTGFIDMNDFKSALLVMRAAKPFEIDIIIRSELYSAGLGMVNYRQFMMDASRIGCIDEFKQSGREPRVRKPFNASDLRHTFSNDRELKKLELSRQPSSLIDRIDQRSSSSMAALLAPRDVPHMTITDENMYNRESEYLPNAQERGFIRQQRIAKAQNRYQTAVNRYNSQMEYDQAHEDKKDENKLAHIRRQQDWYDESTRGTWDKPRGKAGTEMAQLMRKSSVGDLLNTGRHTSMY